MHVCHFCDTTFESDYFRNIAVGLTRHGVRISLVELGRGTPPTWLNEAPGTSYFCLNAGSKLQYPMVVVRLAKYLKDESVDILHTHLFFAGLIGVLTKRLRQKTIVALMRHHTSVVRMLGSRIHIAADKWMAENADHVTTVSEAARNYIQKVDGIRRAEIEVVYTGFDFQKLAPNVDDRRRVRREFSFEADNLVIGYAANFINGKGHLQLIEAYKKIAAAMPNVKLFLVGSGMLSEVKKAAENFAPGQIVFAGWRNDVPECLNAMDIFIQPSLSEAFSQVLVEAMGTGLPVIATRVGGADEVIINGENGILIEPNDTDAIYQATLHLYNDVRLRNEIAQKGMLSVKERFTVPIMIDRLMALYKSWLNQN